MSTSLRTIVVWIPDFPLLALAADQLQTKRTSQTAGQKVDQAKSLSDSRVMVPTSEPVALWDHTGICVCNAPARRMGVRRGMRRRHAQSICPNLVLHPMDEERDARVCEDFVASIDSVASHVELLRPGLIAIDAGAVSRYYGSEDQALEILYDTTARPGVDVFIGCADTLCSAVWAARRAQIIPPGQDVPFLQNLPITALVEDSALNSDPALQELVTALETMGIHSLGQWAALPGRQVESRFGALGRYWHDVAQGQGSQRVAPQQPAADLAVSRRLPEPLARADTAAFIGRQLADELHTQLVQAAAVCTRIVIRATLLVPDPTTDVEPETAPVATAQVCERAWRCADAFTERSIAERVRWQLDAWLNRYSPGADSAIVDGETNRDDSVVHYGLIELTLEPVGVADTIEPGLWQSGGDTQRVSAALERVQAMIGPDNVRTPYLIGGRGPTDRIALVAAGEQPSEEDIGPTATTAAAAPTWVGQLPAPLPARTLSSHSSSAHPSSAHPAARIAVLGADQTPVYVTERIKLSMQPRWLQWGRTRHEITAWAGPWPVDDQWWQDGRRFARMHLVTDQPKGLLVVCHQGRWRIEGVYE